MGNRSSSTPYPPGWPPYAPPPPSGFGGKSNQYPPVAGHPHPMQYPHYRSMLSLNEQPQPYIIHDSIDRRMYMHGSRVSLNQMRMDNAMVPDAKTLKKMEKFDKKQRKMSKKMLSKAPMGIVGHAVPGPIHQSIYPAPSQLYTRALSYDDLQRAQLDMAELRLREQWLRSHPDKTPKFKNTVSDKSSHMRREWNGGSMSSSSPMTSSSDEKSIDQWIKDKRSDSSLRSKNDPLFSSTPHSSRPSSKGEHQIEIKIERKEKIERRTDSQSSIYAQPIARQRRPSTSSYGTSPMRADQSEIDFSWVQDEENRINRERNRDRDSMPECYFGMAPPKVDDTRVKKTAHMLEEESRLQRIRERETEVDSGRTGPAERRLHRIQRESDPKPVRDTQRPWRNSMAY